MRLVLTGRHVQITPLLRRLVDQKLAKLDRLLNDAIVSAQVVLAQDKYRYVAEVSLHARGDHTLHGRGSTAAWETSLGAAVDKINKQALKMKGKWETRKRQAPGRRGAGRTPAETEAPPATRLVRTARYPVKPMTLDDAIVEIDGRADSFLVFRNARTDTVNVIYRRKDGNLALIEP